LYLPASCLYTSETTPESTQYGAKHGEHVELANKKPGRLIGCRATFAKGDKALPGLKIGDVVTVAGDCQGMTGATVHLVDCVLLTDAFTAKAAELIAAMGKSYPAR
jgi:hypothetical protein